MTISILSRIFVIVYYTFKTKHYEPFETTRTSELCPSVRFYWIFRLPVYDHFRLIWMLCRANYTTIPQNNNLHPGICCSIVWNLHVQ